MDIWGVQKEAAAARSGGLVTVHCEQCDQPVVQALDTGNGRQLLLNPEPVSYGQFVLDRSGLAVKAQLVTGTSRDAAEARGEDLYASHLYTCHRGRR